MCYSEDDLGFKWIIESELGFRRLEFTYQKVFIKEKDKFISWAGNFKQCTICKTSLPENTYYFISGGKDKLHVQCKVCEKKCSDKYSWGRNKNYELNNIGFHYCTPCDRILPLDIFHFNKTSGRCNRTGYTSNCKECMGESGFELYSINDNRLFFNIKEGYKVCHDCLVEFPDNDEYFFKKNDRENGMCTCKRCKGFRYGIIRKNVALKDSIPEGIKYCNSCSTLIPEEEFIRNGNKCEACVKPLRRIYNQKPTTKMRIRIHAQLRRSRKKNLLCDLTADEYGEILECFDFSCAYCGLTETENINKYGRRLEQDHIVALSNNGEYTKENIVPACKHCNTSKSARNLIDFLKLKITQKRISVINMYKLFNYMVKNDISIHSRVENKRVV